MNWILRNILGTYKEYECKVSEPTQVKEGFEYEVEVLQTTQYFLWFKIKTTKGLR